jgi:hypothetical protein
VSAAVAVARTRTGFIGFSIVPERRPSPLFVEENGGTKVNKP